MFAILPSWLKVLWLRHVGRHRIGKRVRIGFGSTFVAIPRLSIGDDVVIGSLNLFYQVKELQIEQHVRIGSANLFRGGELIGIGSYASILRLNVFNAIVNPDAVTPLTSRIHLGSGAVITTGHWLDFTDEITIGDHVIIGGRNSSFWTHNRQRTRPIIIGKHCYLGSEVRLAPGAEVAPYCIVALGSVVMGRFEHPHTLIAGNPATVQRDLKDRDLFLVTHNTRSDMPECFDGQGDASELPPNESV